jgi:hypothetical protein
LGLTRVLNQWIHAGRLASRDQGQPIDVVIEPFVEIPSLARRDAEAAAEELAAFFGCKLSLD